MDLVYWVFQPFGSFLVCFQVVILPVLHCKAYIVNCLWSLIIVSLIPTPGLGKNTKFFSSVCVVSSSSPHIDLKHVWGLFLGIRWSVGWFFSFPKWWNLLLCCGLQCCPSAAGLHVPWVCVWALCPFLFPALNCYFEVSVFCRFYGCFSRLLVVLSILLLFCVTCSALRCRLWLGIYEVYTIFWDLVLKWSISVYLVSSTEVEAQDLCISEKHWASSFTTIHFIYYILKCYFDVFFKLLLNVMFCF